MKKKLIRVELSFCTVGLWLENGKIVQAPPIMRYWVGKLYSDFYLYYEKRKKLVSAKVVEDAAEQAGFL